MLYVEGAVIFRRETQVANIEVSPHLYTSWTKRCNKVSLWYHHGVKKQLATSEKNQSSPAIWCKTLFYTYNC